MGFLGSLAQVAGNALPYATNVAAQDQATQAIGQQQKMQFALQALLLQRQQHEQQIQDALRQAQTGQANARARFYGEVPLTYRTDANGNVVGLPSKMPMDGSAPPPSTQPGVGQPGSGPPTPPPPPTVAPLSTGVTQAVKQPNIDPSSPAGIAAANTKAQNAAKARAQYAPPGGANGGMGMGGIGGLARTSAGITEMNQADQMMTPFEEAAKAGTANYTGLDYFKGLMTKMYDAHGMVNQAVHTAAFNNLDQVNPQLSNYLKAGEAWALADGTISGRTSDFRTKLDAFVSSIGPNANPSQIVNTQTMRHTRLAELQKFQPAMEAAANRFLPAGQAPSTPAPPPVASAPPPSPLLQKYNAAVAHLKAQGKSQAQIDATLGPQPPGE